MAHPPILSLCFFAAGTLDLIFALGLYLLAVRGRDKGSNSTAPSKRPPPVIAAILAVIGILTILAGVLQWVWKPI